MRSARRIQHKVAALILLLAPPAVLAAVAAPAHLTTDSLIQPLGIDDPKPRLSWQLRDTRTGARQTSYRIQVATTPALLQQGKPDIWDTGKVLSAQSLNIEYAGPPLTPATRYYWQVKVWDKDGNPYPASRPTWWETGLLDTKNWPAKWIGHEDAELHQLRQSGAQWITNPVVPDYKPAGQSHHDFRLHFPLSAPVRKAVLFTTGRETAAAWLNGKQVLESQPQPPWKQFPWQTYTSREVTSELRPGANLLAIEITRYHSGTPQIPNPDDSLTPMSACLYVYLADGSTLLYKSDATWKAALDSPGQWQSPDYQDTSWQSAITYTPASHELSDSAPGDPWPTGPVKLLRHTFMSNSPIVSARLYATALGAYRLSINGHPVGDQILSPGWTDYRAQVTYQTFDVTQDIKPGANAIGAMLAPGWYSTPLMWVRQGNNYGKTPPALKAQLRLQHADGTIQWVATSESWKASTSPILKSEIYDGETYDARQNQPGWDTPSFSVASEKRWKPAQVVQPTEPEIVSQYFQPVRVEKIVPVATISNPTPGVYIYDFAQNLTGVVDVQAQAPAGTDIQLRFGEILNPDGTLYTDNLRTAKATDHFILSGKGVERYRPAFTFHGFRYVEVKGLPRPPTRDTIKAVVFHTDAPFTAQLHTGSPMVNKLWQNILWGQRSNFVSVPTDCPQRDERLGWAADAQVFWRTAAYNMDLTQFSKKYAADLRGTQVGTSMYGIVAPGTNAPNLGYAAGWSDAGIIIPWTAWLQYGDPTVIHENWTAMENYLAAIQSANPDYLWSKNYGITFGDWLSPEGPTIEPLVATAYWAYDVTLMQQMAHAIGDSASEAKYAALFQNIKAAFAKRFIQSDGLIAGAESADSLSAPSNNAQAKSKAIDTQTGYVLALHMDLVPENLRQAAGDRLVQKIKDNGGKLNTGFLGTPYLLSALVDTGHANIAYQLLLNTEYPSWGYLVGHGATTMWERWNGDQMRNDPGMNSYNHYAYGAVADWIYGYAAGIDAQPSDPGFHTIFLHPNFDTRLGSLDFTYNSAYGEIKSSWTAQPRKVNWTVTVPPNTTAHLPLKTAQAHSYLLSGIAIAESKTAHLLTGSTETQTYELPAGTHTFTITTP